MAYATSNLVSVMNRTLCALLCASASAMAADPYAYRPTVTWAADHHSLSFDLFGQKGAYPGDLDTTAFPAPGAPQEVTVTSAWPVAVIRARWSMATADWPKLYRSNVLDLLLLYACDVEMYDQMFAKTVAASEYTSPPEFLAEAADPLGHSLLGRMCGKEVRYKIVARAGVGAADYTIETRMRVGVSSNQSTVFIHNDPEHISAHLNDRQILCAAHDAGDVIRLEMRLICVCGPRTMLKGEMMSRITNNMVYFANRLYQDLGRAPSAESIGKFLSTMRAQAKRDEAP